MFRLYRHRKALKSARRSGFTKRDRVPFVRFFGVAVIAALLSISTFGGIVTAQENTTSTQEDATSAQEEDQPDDEKTEKEKRKEQLRKKLEELQSELDQLEGEAAEYRNEAQSHERDISLLENEIRQIRIQISQSRIIIQQTSEQIEANKEVIKDLEKRAARQEELLSKLVLSMYKLDNTSSVEIILTSNSLSEFFNDVTQVRNLQKSMKKTLTEVQEIKKDIEKQVAQLDQKATRQTQLLQAQASQRRAVDQKVDKKEQLLAEARAQENQISNVAEQKRKTITEVRNQIFRLEGAGVAVSFEDAYNYAKDAARLTGVRPALLLSILKQESSWGKNVGLCKLHNRESGDGIGINTGTIYPRTMKVGRDIEPFFQITQELGRDPYDTLISCWPQIYYDADGDGVKETPYGYGGAMGPAQFLPSTWMGYRERVSQLVGQPADPWRIDHAFTASAVKLAAAGAAQQTYNAEWCAAMIYYSGSCSRSVNINRFYADQVMQRAAEYQKDIDILEGN